MSISWPPTLVGLALLAGVLVFAVVRPRRLPEVVAALPAALIALLVGLVPWSAARDTEARLGPTIGFLAAILVISHLADDDGVFRWLGQWLGRASRGRPIPLLGLVFLVASATTIVLSLDATVVLLTPVVLIGVRKLRVAGGPPLYATAHLSNTASLLLPISNLTNLLAYQASGLTFLHFAGLMIVPTLLAVGVEYVVFRWFFRRSLTVADGTVDDEQDEPLPRNMLIYLGLTLVALACAPLIGLETAEVAGICAVLLAARALVRRRVTWKTLLREVNIPFLAFVAALGIVVDAATAHGLQSSLAEILPAGTGFVALLAIAGLAAVLANVVNNLPATLVLLGALGGHPAPVVVLAVLIGVNLGPNLTYVGSLAVLLWRRILHAEGESISLGRFTRLGLATVPATVIAATAGLWLVALI